jgi:multidrug efflux pump
MAKFFIDRPIFAWVIAILIMMAGAFSVLSLPVAQYPSIAATEVSINANYPGASARTVADAVTQVIEQQMKGLDRLLYMYSYGESSGRAQVRFAFEAGTNIDIALVQVQNKLQLALPLLPEEVQRQGVSVEKSGISTLISIMLTCADGSQNGADLTNYIASYIQDPISRLPGVGELTLYGTPYAMRIWCDPDKFRQFSLNPSEVVAAIRSQNAQVAGGQVAAGPNPPGQEINFTIIASERMRTPEEFENVILRTEQDGSVLRLRDVARVELNQERFWFSVRYNGEPAACLDIKLAPGGNALETIAAVKKEMASLSAFFPPGVSHLFPNDTGPIVSDSIRAVFETLVEATVLVFLVMFLFLQSFRATLIPTVAIPVVLLGTFGVMSAAGFSINTLTMFGMVLAVGLLVDNAIVVVENVERLMRQERLGPREAAVRSMEQITGALVGVAVAIAAVFVPMAFLGGATGVIYRQFSITIVTAMTLSVIVAIVLTPAMCATMLPNGHPPASQGLFGKFNRWFEWITLRYQRQVRRSLSRRGRFLAAFAVALALIGAIFHVLPSAFLPEEDQGILRLFVRLPPGATFERTDAVLARVDRYFREKEPAVESVMTISGASYAGSSQNVGNGVVQLKDWKDRKGRDLGAAAVAARAMAAFSGYPEGEVFVFAPPAVLELGSATGFDFELIDRAGLGHESLMAARARILEEAGAHPALRNVRPNGLDDVEQYRLRIDMARAGAQSLDTAEINTTIAAFWGGMYVNDFMDKGRTKKVFIQAEADKRLQASDFKRYYVRNGKGEMVPFSSFLTVDSTMGSSRLERYGGLPSIEILGEAAPGYSSGQAMEIMESLVDKLPQGFGYAWTKLSYQERLTGGQAPTLYAVSLAVVFLCLAALYESWTIPFSVLLVAPLGAVGALGGVLLRGMNNDIYFQIGLLTVIGLSAKNSILIVEFARDMHARGQDLLRATTNAVRLRLRPIIMTSLCFILGVIPLAVSSGAGAGGQNAIGTTVVFGVSVTTALGIYYTPIFFVLVTRLFARKQRSGGP